MTCSETNHLTVADELSFAEYTFRPFSDQKSDESPGGFLVRIEPCDDFLADIAAFRETYELFQPQFQRIGRFVDVVLHRRYPFFHAQGLAALS